MIRKISSSTLLLAVSSLAIADEENQDFKLAKPITTSTSAVAIERVNPKYPTSAARNGDEGWVTFSFTVEPDGSVSNLIPLEHSGSRVFIRSAAKALENWKYQPAMENDQPIQSCLHSVRLDFRMGSQGVRSNFQRFYKKASKALLSNDAQTIEDIGRKIDGYKTKLYDEESYIKVLQLNYAAAIKDDALYDTRLQQISIHTIQNTLPKSWTSIAQQKINLLVSQHKLADALLLLKQIKQDKNSHLSEEQIEHIRARIIGFQDSDMHLIVRGNVNENSLWQHNLTRNQFSLQDIKGDLESIDLRCDNKRKLYTVNETTLWKIPSHWQNCQVYITGDTSATFELVEYPSLTANDADSDNVIDTSE